MTAALEAQQEKLRNVFGESVIDSGVRFDELTVTLEADSWATSAKTLRDQADFKFDQLIDLCGLDYSEFSGGVSGTRYAVVYHLLSLDRNQRLRVKVFASDDDLPMLPSMIDVWPASNWFEREAFDLYGIVFTDHPDLRRILTDYGFIGHPFRKDFPISGNVEMRYDPDQQRVVYQPVSIEPREIVPRVVREANYGGVK